MTSLIEYAPFLPSIFMTVLLVAAGLVLVLLRVKRVKDLFWRALLFAVLAVILMNPVILNEVRQGLPDKLVIVVDKSASQNIAARDKTAAQAKDYLLSQVQTTKNLEPILIETGGDDETNLFAALHDGFASVPLSQVAGTVFITDGQVHDVPEALGSLAKMAPFHAVLTGSKEEFDRKVTVVSAPKYGLLSADISMTIKVEEIGKTSGTPVTLNVKQDGELWGEVSITPGMPRHFSFTLNHPGQNVFEFAVPEAKGELTVMNNTAPVIVSGIRDRLRVLLVSGAPHMGERAWRNILKSDPSIDLIHFTILRSLRSVDSTPQHELALIAFPVQELFEKRLQDFDLIIFDKYEQFHLLRMQYFFNIVDFIRNGGAFLMAMDSDHVSDGIYKTPLGDVLPVKPQEFGKNATLRAEYKPHLTLLGERHPVTGHLKRYGEEQKWGSWYAQVPADILGTGQALMSGMTNLPLLVIDKIGKGRVAVLTSDNIWLWAKGGSLRGPYTELLRNTAHWLMKEPELEEDYIKAELRGDDIHVAQRVLDEDKPVLTTRRPDGSEEKLILNTEEDGWHTATVKAEQNGIYSFESGKRKTFVAVGAAQNREFSDVHTTDEKFKPVLEQTGGTVIWYPNQLDFKLRDIAKTATRAGGDNWIGVKRNKSYAVRHVESHDFFPGFAALFVLLGLLVLTWWRENGGKSSG